MFRCSGDMCLWRAIILPTADGAGGRVGLRRVRAEGGANRDLRTEAALASSWCVAVGSCDLGEQPWGS